MGFLKKFFGKDKPKISEPEHGSSATSDKIELKGHEVTTQPTSDQVVARNAGRLRRLRQALQLEASKTIPDEARMKKLNHSIKKYQALQDYYDLSKED